MANGIPVRLSIGLAKRAREVARIQDRSLTEQVEHWARLGQSVEAAVLASTVAQLKTASYDERLPEVLAASDTTAARKRAARSIARKNPQRYGTTASSPTKIIKVSASGRRRVK
jgi:hypothetical protein